MVTAHESATVMTAHAGLTGAASNPGPVSGAAGLQPLVTSAVRQAAIEMTALFAAAENSISERIDGFSRRAAAWTASAGELTQRSDLRQRRTSVEDEAAIAARMRPERQLVRPLLIVVPTGHPVAGSSAAGAQVTGTHVTESGEE
jgi:hypothetical protein